VLSAATLSDAARNAVTNLPQVFASNSKCLFAAVGVGKLVQDLVGVILDGRQQLSRTQPPG